MSVLQGSVYPAEMDASVDLTAATVSLAVTAPDLTSTTLTPTKVGTVATAPIPAAQVGTYLLVWTVSGPSSGVVQDQFTVKAAVMDLISLPDLRDELNLGDTSKDVKLRRWIRSANEVIENVTGPIRAHAEIESLTAGNSQHVLEYRWVSSITSLVEGYGASAVTLAAQTPGTAIPQQGGYFWDKTSNILTRCTAGGYPTNFRTGSVSYIAGLASIPDDIQLATAELIKHWYRKSEVAFKSSAFGASPGDDAYNMPGNYMVPNAVMEILEPWRRSPELA